MQMLKWCNNETIKPKKLCKTDLWYVASILANSKELKCTAQGFF